MKSSFVFMAVMALVCSLVYAQPQVWEALIDNPMGQTGGRENGPFGGYGVSALSSYVTGELMGRPFGYVLYWDRAPPAGQAGYINQVIQSAVGSFGGPPAYSNGTSYALTGGVLTSKLTRLSNSHSVNYYLLFTKITDPKQVYIWAGLVPLTLCRYNLAVEQWAAQPTLMYTSPSGFEIEALSAAVLNDFKFIAVSLSSHDEPGPVMLFYTWDMTSFNEAGKLTQEDGTFITTYESFTIFTAISIEDPTQDALYIYYIESATGAARLRYAHFENAKIGKFLNVGSFLPFNNGDARLSGQLGTAASVSRDKTKVLLIRHGADVCATADERTVMQRMFLPTVQQVSPEIPVFVKNLDGSIIAPDPISMPTLISDPCAGDVFPGWQAGMVWLDRTSFYLMQGMCNPF